MPFILFEKGAQIASSVLSWKHVRMFSPWEFNMDSAAKELLMESGWHAPAKDHMPTGLELVNEYLLPLSQLKQLQSFIHLQSSVKAIYRKGFDKMKTAGRDLAVFIIEYEQHGNLLRIEASSVIDATGTWLTPNPMSFFSNVCETSVEVCVLPVSSAPSWNDPRSGNALSLDLPPIFSCTPILIVAETDVCIDVV
nr:hypothetical protein [Paenibacillus catalpae]